MIWEVYKITNTITGKAYIGISKFGADRRFKTHCKISTANSGHYLHASMRKHGIINFKLEVLTECYSREETIVCERAQIAKYGTLVPAGYNLTSGGDGLRNFKMPIHAIANMVEKHKSNPEWIKNLAKSKLGTKHTTEHNESIKSGQNRRRIREQSSMTVEQRAAFIEKCSLPKRGKKFTEKHKRKLSEIKQQRWKDPEFRERMLQAQKTRRSK